VRRAAQAAIGEGTDDEEFESEMNAMLQMLNF
jgi:hypothetical protein